MRATLIGAECRRYIVLCNLGSMFHLGSVSLRTFSFVPGPHPFVRHINGLRVDARRSRGDALSETKHLLTLA